MYICNGLKIYSVENNKHFLSTLIKYIIKALYFCKLDSKQKWKVTHLSINRNMLICLVSIDPNFLIQYRCVFLASVYLFCNM